MRCPRGGRGASTTESQIVVYFRSQFTTTAKSFRAAPPRSEFIETYQPRFFGTGPDSTVQIWEITPAPPAIWRMPPEITRSPFLQVACPVAKKNEPSNGVVSRSTSLPKRRVSFPRPPARSAVELLLEKAKAVPPSAMKRAIMATAIAGEGWGILSFILPNDHLDWPEVATGLEPVVGGIATATDGRASPYGARFRQGAVLVPRMLLTVEEQAGGRIGISAGRCRVRSARSSNEKLPWRDLAALEGVVEKRFLRPVHLGSTIVGFRSRTPLLAVIPELDGELMDGEDDRIEDFPGLAEWWRKAESIWEENRSPSTRLTLCRADQLPEQAD